MGRKGSALSVPVRTATLDAGVEQAKGDTQEAAEKGPMKRLTVDVPEDLHRDLKLACVQRGEMMSTYVRELLQKAMERD